MVEFSVSNVWTFFGDDRPFLVIYAIFFVYLEFICAFFGTYFVKIKKIVFIVLKYIKFMKIFNEWLSNWFYRTTSGFLTFSESKRFILYMIYAWGLSSLLTIMVVVLDSTPSLPENLQPGIGSGSCFLKSMNIILTFEKKKIYYNIY